MEPSKNYGWTRPAGWALMVVAAAMSVFIFGYYFWPYRPQMTVVDRVADPVPGQVWEWADGSQSGGMRYGPWPRRDGDPGNLILDVRDGWVRFDPRHIDEQQRAVRCRGISLDKRMPLDEFKRRYRREVPSGDGGTPSRSTPGGERP